MSTGSWTHDPGKCSAKVATARTYSKNKPFCHRTVVDDGLCRIHLAVRERAKTRAPKPTYAELRSALDAAEARLAAVRELHRPVGRFGYCATCAYAIYPCPTVRALDGTEEADR